MLNYLPIILFSMIFAAFPLLAWLHYKKIIKGREYYAGLARELGLVYEDSGVFGYRSIHGTYQNVPLMCREQVRGSGKNRSHYSIFTADLDDKDVPQELHLYREGMFSFLGKAVGGQDIQVNDAELNKAFIIRAASENGLQAFFQRPNVKHHLLAALNDCSEFQLKNNQLYLEYRGDLISKYELTRHRLNLLVQCAHAIAQFDPLQIQAQPAPHFIHPAAQSTAPNLTNAGDSW